MDSQYQYLDIKIPTKEPESGLVDVVNSVRPSWDKDELDLKVGILVNKFLKLIWLDWRGTCIFYHSLKENWISLKKYCNWFV